MKIIKLKHGQECIVDDEDFEGLNRHKWLCASSHHTKYAIRYIYNKGAQTLIHMHKEVMGLNGVKDVLVDHKDFNGLNNQKTNLRPCTISQNNTYRRKFKKSTSRYIGVYYERHSKKWSAQIFKNYKRINLGSYYSEGEAASAYNEMAKKLNKDFASFNTIDPNDFIVAATKIPKSRSTKKKVVLDFSTGVYYSSAKDASNSATIAYSTMRTWLNVPALNKTELRYV